MRSKLLCAVSLLLNVALAGYWLKARVMVSVATRSALAAPTAVPQPVQRSAPPRISERVPVASPPGPRPVPWSRIESEDYPAFIANLRAAGCPERTIRDIVAREIDTLYQKRKNKPAEAPREDDFWTTQDARESRQRTRRLAELELEGERRTLLKTLLGVEGDWPKARVASPEEWAGFCAMLTPPTFEAAEEMGWVLDRTEFEKDRIETVAGSPLKLSEIEALGRLRNDSLAKVVSLVGQPRIDEALGLIRIAMVAIEDLDFLESDDPRRRISEAELRRLVQAQSTDLSAVDEAFGFDAVTELERFRAGLPKDASSAHKAAFLASLGSALGEQRARELTLLSAAGWSEVEDFVREKQLPPTTSEMLVEARNLAAAEAARIRRDPSLSAEQERDRLRQIGDQIRTAFGEALPPAVLTDYLDEHGDWIEAIEAGEEDDE